MRNTVILFYPRTGYEEGIRYFHVPYSVLALASVLDRNRFAPLVIDNNVDHENDPLVRLRETLIQEDVLCVGISSMIGHQIRDGLHAAEICRSVRPDVPIVWGGGLPTLMPDVTIQHPNVDIVVRGQGEITFQGLVLALADGTSLSQVHGLTYKSEDQIWSTPDRKTVALDSLPPYHETYHLINLNDYLRNDQNIGTRTVSYHSSQGCAYECGFCCESALWARRWLPLSVDRMIEDITFLVSEHGVNGIKFYDSEFFVSRSRSLAFAEQVLTRNLHIGWGAAIHPLNLSKFDLREVRLLRQSGLSRLMIGAESVIASEIGLIKKHITPDLILDLVRTCSQNGIAICVSFITGFPNGPQEAVEKTIQFASQIRQIDARNEVQINFYSPYPGTPMYSLALTNGFMPPRTLEEWSWYDYREVNTPWVDPGWSDVIRKFNQNNYPYLRQTNWSVAAIGQ